MKNSKITKNNHKIHNNKVELGEITALIPSRMLDMLIEWRLQAAMPFFKRVKLYTSANHKSEEFIEFDSNDNDCWKLRSVSQKDDKYLKRGSFSANKSFSEIVRKVEFVQKNIVSRKLEVKIESAVVVFDGYEFDWTALKSKVMTHELLESVKGTDEKPGLLSINPSTNDSMVLVCTNSEDIPRSAMNKFFRTVEENRGKIVKVQEIITKETTRKKTYGLVK